MAVCVPARSVLMMLMRGFGGLFRREAPQAPQSIPSSDRLHPDARDGVVVVDVSPSMLESDWPPSRLVAAQDGAIRYCERLADEEPDARIAIVAYGGAARIVCPLTPAFQQEALIQAIRSIEIINATDIAAGLRAAAEALRNARMNQQVVILSDGQHNMFSNPRAVARSLKAHAVIEAYKQVGFNVPLVVRLEGTEVEEGRRILAESDVDIINAEGLTDAAIKVVAAIKS